LLGFTFTDLEMDYARGMLVVEEKMLQPSRTWNGGLSALVAEDLASLAAGFRVAVRGEGVIGQRVNMNHVSAARLGEKLIATTRCVHAGKTTQLWRVDIHAQPLPAPQTAAPADQQPNPDGAPSSDSSVGPSTSDSSDLYPQSSAAGAAATPLRLISTGDVLMMNLKPGVKRLPASSRHDALISKL